MSLEAKPQATAPDTTALAKTETSQVNSSSTSGQFPATRFFCDVVEYVHNNLPLKRHWRNFRTYNDCFAASEAIDWLCRNLKPSANAKTQTAPTRQQATYLLQFFLREKIIEDVRVGEKVSFKELQDDDRLYKFCYNNRYLANRSHPSKISASVTETSTITTNASSSVSTSSLSSTTISTCSLKRAGSIRVKCDNKENYIKLGAGLKDDKQLISELDFHTRASAAATQKAPESQLPIIRLEPSKHESTRTTETSLVAKKEKGAVSAPISKNESEIWARVARKFLEAILKKAVLNQMQFDCKRKLDATKRELELFTKHIDVRISHFLEDNNLSVASSLISGHNIHHNCTHINKHGVVINDKDDDLPAWLVRAMMHLLEWKGGSENEVPKFEDIFAEINSYFMKLAEPLLTKKFSKLFTSIIVFLLSQSQQQQQLSGDTSATASVGNEFSVTRSSESNQSEISNESYLNFARNFQSQLGYNPTEFEAKLVENAKMPFVLPPCLTIGANEDGELGLIETDAFELGGSSHSSRFPSTSQLINSDPCRPDLGDEQESVLQKFLNWVNENNYEVSEMLSALNSLSGAASNEFSTLGEPSENEPLQFVNKSTYDRRASMAAAGAKRPFNHEASEAEEDDGQEEEAEPDEEEDDEEDDDDESNMPLGLRRFGKISLSSPKLHQTSKSMMKERKLRRNNSFKAAIGRTPPVQRNSCARKVMEKRAKYEQASGVGSPKISKTATTTKSSSNLRSASHTAQTRHQMDYYDGQQEDEFKFKVPEPVAAESSTYKVGSGIQKSKSMNFAYNEYKKLQENIFEMIRDRSDAIDDEDTNESHNIRTTMYKRRTSGLLFQQALLAQADPQLTHSKLMSHLNALNLIQTNAHSCSSLNKIQEELDKRSQLSESTMPLSSSLFNLSSFASQASNSSAVQNESVYSFRSERLPSATQGGSAPPPSFGLKKGAPFSDISYLSKISDSLSCDTTQKQLEQLNLSLFDEIESETLCFLIKAFRLCALMLPPSNKRKLHLLLRFLYKLKYNEYASAHLVSSSIAAEASMLVGDDYEDLNFIDASTLTAKSTDMSLTAAEQSSHYSFLAGQPDKSLKRKSQGASSSKAKCLERSKTVEKVIIKAFFKAIVFVENGDSERDSNESKLQEMLAMKLVQILINNYTEIMRIPGDLVSNVQQKLVKLKASEPPSLAKASNETYALLSTTTQLESSASGAEYANAPKTMPTRFCSKMSLQQYELEKAENSRKHLSDLLNRILSDTSMKEDERLMRLKKFKESHPDVYEEKYPQIKKALNILGISESASYLIIQTDDNIGRKRAAAAAAVGNQSAMMGITPSKKFSSILAARNSNTTINDSASMPSSSSYLLNQTALPFVSTTKSSVSSMLTNTTKFFLNKKVKQKENK